MSAKNTQQGHIYNGCIQEFFPLFDEAKKENDPVYNARVGFNIVRFLIERSNWNEDKNKNRAYEFILQGCDKTKKARKELEREVQKRLKDYIEGGIKEDGVKIYGNHTSITLEGNKKEFKISEFLNSDFCQKNGISGFSTLHSDGKSGMHGFIAKEEGRKIRYYTVTDGSYEMTLNWYVNGERCTAKINIDKDGVDLVERNGVTDAQLQANRDVKIGGLFLHQIQFREKGKGQVNEIQKDSQSFETTTRVNRGAGSRTTISRSDSESDLGYESQEESYQNRRTPPPQPPIASSLKKNIFDEKGENSFTKSINQRQNKLSSNATGMAQKQSIKNVLEKIEKGSQYDPKRNWLKAKMEGEENNHNLYVIEEKLSQKSGQSSIIEKRENGDSKPLLPTSTGESTCVGDAQLQKGSYRSGQEHEEESNFQRVSKTLEKWKKKRLNNYRKIEEDIKKAGCDTQEKIQTHHTNDLTPFGELKQRLSQKSYGLKQVNPKARYVSSQTRKQLAEAGLLKDNSADVKKVAERENADTNLTTDKNGNLHILLEKDVAQLKAGVIEEKREDTLVEHTNSHHRNRIVLANRSGKLLWAKNVAELQQEKGKGISV